MNEAVVKKPRHVIPRWRDFATTAAMGELGAMKLGVVPVSLASNLDEAKQTWVSFKSPLTAGELLTAALIDRDWNALEEASTFLVREDVEIPSLTRDIARQALEWSATQKSFPTIQESSTTAAIFKPSIIGVIRRTLSSFPKSAIHWVELALAYSIIGRPEKARRAIRTALQLAPNDRFVLRCATRFFIHQDLPDEALAVLNSSHRTASDSWLLSAHVSVAAILEKNSRFFKQARNVFASKDIARFHLSELGSALATNELTDGNDRKAKKLFKSALIDPTENALAQAVWAKNNFAVEHQSSLMQLPRSFEANTRILLQTELWDQALSASESWLNDEPFSSGPAILGSFIAGTAQEDYEKVKQIAIAGLLANPYEPTLLNNLAFAQACSGDVSGALHTLNEFQKTTLNSEQETAFFATEGIMYYRSGRYEEGRASYRKAIHHARSHNLKSHLLRATVYYAREELKVNPVETSDSIREVVDLARDLVNPVDKLILQKLNEDLKALGLPEVQSSNTRNTMASHKEPITLR